MVQAPAPRVPRRLSRVWGDVLYRHPRLGTPRQQQRPEGRDYDARATSSPALRKAEARQAMW